MFGADYQQVGSADGLTYLNDHNKGSGSKHSRMMGWSELHGDVQREAEMTSRRQLDP